MVRLTSLLSAALALTSLSAHVLAHGDESPAALAARDLHIVKSKRALSACSDKLYERSRIERRLAKRNQLAANHLKKRAQQSNQKSNQQGSQKSSQQGGQQGVQQSNQQSGQKSSQQGGQQSNQKSGQQSNQQSGQQGGQQQSGSNQGSGSVSSSVISAGSVSSTVSAVSVQSTGISGITDPASLFNEVSCILTPEVTIGPYHVDGELIRSDVTESQEGVDLILDLEVINVNTCEPIENVYLDLWHCNATGVYSGVVASGNGDSSDASNVNTTFLRGLQPTDSDGIAQFTTIFPGWYAGRAVHIHVAAHVNGSVADNGTYIDGAYSHIGQLFFDQDLISSIAELEPYTFDTADLMTNSEDGIYAQENVGYDALANYTLLGETVADGLLAWISIGIDPTADNSDAATGAGSVEAPSVPSGAAASGFAPSGAVPSGAVPSGAIPSA
ncbi:hypothetical protein RUND412_006765 [Rhizina undulata]